MVLHRQQRIKILQWNSHSDINKNVINLFYLKLKLIHQMTGLTEKTEKKNVEHESRKKKKVDKSLMSVYFEHQ
jgi:hypothetical protein